MIRKRRKARERRLERGAQIAEWRKDLRKEAELELALASKAKKDGTSVEMVYQPYMADWGAWCSVLLPSR
jgi:hypothetical protein